MNDSSLGRWGERAAEEYLRKHKHYIILYRNYRNAIGEIDLIAIDGNTIVFVEVKTRSTCRCGRPSEAVEARKQHKIIAVAKSYLTRFDSWEQPCRFDVVEVMAAEKGFIVNHIPNAFMDAGRY
ncbi:MAG: YraN family protein [Megasphaera sp.]|jgi:putative endonuclease|nr:YraN family protein [Megasphaera sp.]MCI1247740.1 YraN family protein [Megasphaera sp.]